MLFFFPQSVLLHSSPACKAAVPLSFGIEVEKKLTFSWRCVAELDLFNRFERFSHTVAKVF